MDDPERGVQRRRQQRRKNELVMKSILAFLIVVVAALAALLVYELFASGQDRRQRQARIDEIEKQVQAARDAQRRKEEAAAAETSSVAEVAAQADFMAQQYDYDGAIRLLQSRADYDLSSELQNKAADLQAQKENCRAWPLEEVTHVFFHTLVKDDAKAFDGDGNEPGYNQVMTTISEFNSIIEQMYEKGFVMVSLHDMCTVNEDGTVSRGEIMLPSGKIPFVLSQDDVSYYHYMVGDGFAEKLIVDENGDIKNTYIEDDGSVSVGDYDMVPLIDRFVSEHPDFSYRGHKGIIALTGYEGVLGYRTDEVYRTRESGRVTNYQQAFLDANPDFDFDAEVAAAREVAEAMKAEGWEFASHTWGHINPLAFGYDATVQDTERWLANVATVVGDTDVLIFAFGADISDWHPYTTDNDYFTYLKGKGFSIFCNVDSSRYWVQFGETYMRQGRRNLDGYRMYYNPDMLSDLFDVGKAWDDNRPTPVPEM